MAERNNAGSTFQLLKNGYEPKGYVTREVNGKTVQVPVSELKIIPPTAGTAAVFPKKNPVK
jgi:hypothetical protein